MVRTSGKELTAQSNRLSGSPASEKLLRIQSSVWIKTKVAKRPNNMATGMKHMVKIKEITDSFIQDSADSANDYTNKVYNLIKETSELSILNLVEALSNALTSKDVEIRLKGTKLLAQYMHV